MSPRLPTRTQTVSVGSCALTVSAFGEEQPGAPLILLHGAGGSYLHWPPRLRRMPGRPVYALELPGHGRTPGPGLAKMSDFVALVRAWLDQAGIPRRVLAGHSLGGAIALSLALDEPERAAGLILVGSGARLRVAPDLLRLLREDIAAAAAFITERSYAPATPPDKLEHYGRALLRMDPETLHGAYAACDGFDVRGQLPALRVPALIVGAAADRMTPPHLSREAHEALAGSALQILPDTGHMIPIERPADLTTAVSAFLRATAI